MAKRKGRRNKDHRDADDRSWLGMIEAVVDIVFFIPRAIGRVIMHWVD